MALYNTKLPEFKHVTGLQLHQASLVQVQPDETQIMIAKYYGINPVMLTDVNCVCDAKSVYAYVLIATRSYPTAYECADAAGVGYPNLYNNNRMLDQERNSNSVFGRHLDLFISSHKNRNRHV